MNLETTRLRSRPKNRWSEGRSKTSWWKERVYNRAEWKKLLWTARNRRSLHMPTEWMNWWMNEWSKLMKNAKILVYIFTIYIDIYWMQSWLHNPFRSGNKNKPRLWILCANNLKLWPLATYLLLASSHLSITALASWSLAVAFSHPKWEETSRDSSFAPEKECSTIRSPMCHVRWRVKGGYYKHKF